MSNNNSQTFDIQNFTIRDMTNMGKELRNMSEGAGSLECAAGRIVNYFYKSVIDGGSGNKACALARLFVTADYGKLPGSLQDFASRFIQSDSIDPHMKCLTLMGTVGDQPQWNSRDGSVGHQAIPLPSEEVINSIPMIQNLISQFGLDAREVINPNPELILDMEQKTYNVFFVQEALGSDMIPAQEEFVVPFGIQSVLGFGGLFPSGEMYVVILFFKVRVPAEVVDYFKSLSLNIKVSLLGLEDILFEELKGRFV